MDTLPNVDNRRSGNLSPSARVNTCMLSKKNISGVSVENALNENAYWYVLRVSYHREQRAVEWLTSQGVETYLPLHFVKKKVNGKLKRQQEPLIPNLIFVHTQLSKLVTLMKSATNTFLSFYYNHFAFTSEGKNPPLRLNDPNLKLNSFILSDTPYHQVLYKDHYSAQQLRTTMCCSKSPMAFMWIQCKDINFKIIYDEKNDRISLNKYKMAEREKIAAPRGAANAQERLLQKMYISNVAKRLRELNQPTDNDRKRWVWELIQNAKDTIVNDPKRTTVNINIMVNGDTMQFVHDGNPFTLDARFGLLWKYSEDKENQESTGRFGTGFLTTHCLSKIVDIQSDVYGDNDEVNGFEVTMFRDGQTEAELLQGLNKMKDSERWYKQPFGKTTYTYHVKTDSGRRAIQLGIENFKENIAQTMLFCNELASVTLNYNGEITTIKRQVKEYLGDGIYRTSFALNNGGSHYRTFIYTSFSEHNNELSKKYKAERSIRIDAAIEVDENNNIISHRGKTSFFCSLPLVGIEDQLDEPLIINSPDFEPDSERQSLILSGETHLDENCLITENGINHLIYEHIMPLYDKIVSYLSRNGYNKLFELASGLKSAKNNANLDKNWYEENVIKKYRAILLKYPVATSYRDGASIKLSDAIFVKASKEEENSAFSLLTALYPDKLVKENHEWSDLLWKEGLNVWGTKEICKDIEAKGNWNYISLTGGIEIADWYNRFLKHVSEYDDKLLKECALLPNLNGKLLNRDTEGFRQGENLDDTTIALIAAMGKDIRPYILHTSITAVTLEHKYNSTAYSSELNVLAKEIIQSKSIDKLNRLLPLLSVIVSDSEKYSEEYVSSRKAYYHEFTVLQRY